MSSLGYCASLLSSLFVFHYITSFGAESQATFLYNQCSNTTFSPNSTYENNLSALFSSLSSRNASYARLLDNATVGETTDRVYGLFMCRGDQSVDVCRDCVSSAVTDSSERCPNRKEAVIWYDECWLRYSPQNIFSKMQTAPSVRLYNTQNITNGEKERFVGLVVRTTRELSGAASSNRERFAVKQANFSNFRTLYALAQCTRDLSSSSCNSCLQQAAGQLDTSQVGARVLFPSCNIRFELYPFYNESGVAVPPAARPPSPRQPPRSNPNGGGLSVAVITAIVVPVTFLVLLLLAGCIFLVWRGKRSYSAVPEENVDNSITTPDSLQFDFTTVEAATDKFSDSNKLGAGGFGEVFKGKLPNGQEIAVKRLSQNSGQGVEEFKNEVLVLARLQHRNLARLLGFCLEEEEKILVYEFVPNKSLDYFLFDTEKRRLLHWPTRYKIIGGIARGLLYLHQDSRLTIIHRDLKASNILLDSDMNAKISDFGMARIFGVDQTQERTGRVVGTYGYMAPEYAMRGNFSMKSDIYSFGVLILEMITGKRNSSFYDSDDAGDLISYVWRHWNEGAPFELVDPTLEESYGRDEVIRCIHIGLLCVQEDPADRPTSTTINLMLNSSTVTLPVPQNPGYHPDSLKSKGYSSAQSTNKSNPVSVDEGSITELYPR